MDKDVLNSVKAGFGLAGKLVGKGVDEVSKVIKKGDEGRSVGDTGLYFTPQDASPEFGLIPSVRFLEAQDDSRFDFNILRNLTTSAGEKAFVAGLHALLVGNTNEAKSRLRESTSKGKDSKVQLTDAYFVLGCLLLEEEEPQEAIRHFKTALLAQQSLGKQLSRYLPSLHAALPLTEHSSFCFYPDLLGLNLAMSLALRLTGNTEEAVHTLEQVLGIMPGDPVAEFFVNLFRAELGQHRTVFDSLQSTLPDSNIQVANMVLLGKACVALGDPVTAREIFRKALQREHLDPTLRLDLRHSLGEALAAEGWANDAVEEFQSVKAERPGYEAINKRLGMTERAPREEAPPAPVKQPAKPTEEIVTPAPAPIAQVPAPAPTPPKPLIDAGGKVSRLVCEARELDVDLTAGPITIGREEGDVVLEGDSAASRLHAQITPENEMFYIEDLGSTNGTWVNRHKITRRVELHRGDLVQIGETSFQVL